jgi:hypothetical protein
MARCERAGTFAWAESQEQQKTQLQHSALFAPYVTSSTNETLVTNYKFVIERSVTEW